MSWVLTESKMVQNPLSVEYLTFPRGIWKFWSSQARKCVVCLSVINNLVVSDQGVGEVLT